MAPQAIMAGLNIAASAAPLFFGPNSIFSGKLRQAEKGQEEAFRRSQAMQLPTEYTQALQNRLAQANVGIPSAALGLYQQQAARAQAGQLAGLRDRRSALAGIGGIAQAGQDAALQLASMQGQALLSGQERANQALMQMGGLKYQEELRKQEEAQQYYGGRKAEAAGAQSAALAGLGQAMGTALSTGAFKGQPKLPTTPTAFKGLSDIPTTSQMMQTIANVRPSSPYASQMGMMSRPQFNPANVFGSSQTQVNQSPLLSNISPMQYSAFGSYRRY
jgi:hypothetical protein